MRYICIHSRQYLCFLPCLQEVIHTPFSYLSDNYSVPLKWVDFYVILDFINLLLLLCFPLPRSGYLVRRTSRCLLIQHLASLFAS